MKIKHQANLAENEAQIQGIIDIDKNDPKLVNLLLKRSALTLS